MQTRIEELPGQLEKEVAQRRRAEAELRESRERLAGVIDSAMDAIITVDAAQRITLFNAAAEKMFRFPAAEAIGQPLDRFIPARFREAHRHHVENFGHSGVTKRSMGALGAVFGLRADGEEFPAEASISQLESDGQKFYTVILRDITGQKKLEAQFLRAQATALGIVKSHNGFINVYSEVGKGAQFTLYLPAHEAAALQPAQATVPGLPSGRGELILIVDDEQAIREITRTALEAFNYRAIAANDGAQAVALFARHSGEVKAVLTDMMMPVMDGGALIAALRSLDPQIRIIASSGFSAAGKMAEATSAGVNAFLPKPCTAEKLLKTLAEALGNCRM